MLRDAITHLNRWSTKRATVVTLVTLVALGAAPHATAQQALRMLPDTQNKPTAPAWQPLPPLPQTANHDTQPAQRATYQSTVAGPESAQFPGPSAVAGGPLPASVPVDVWTLRQAEGVALQFNPILRRAVARIASAQGDALQAGLYPNPRFDTNNPQVFAATSTSLNAGFQQQIVVKGKLRLDKAAATEVVRQREIGLTQDRFSLLTSVRQQFYTVLADQRQVEVLSEVREVAIAAVRAAQGRVEATEGTLPEVLLLQTELQRAEIALKNAETDLYADRRQLAAIIGRPDISIERTTGELTSGFPEYDRNDLRQFVVSQNAQVQIARRDIDRNQILAKRARVEAFPNPTMGPAYVYTIPQTTGGQAFWFNLTFDIPTWNRNQGNIRSAQSDVVDAAASLGTLQNSLLRQADDALGRYRAARQSEERYRTQILPTARRSAQLVKDGYQKGVLDISTYLSAQRALADASSEYVDALQSVWTTAAEIAGLLQMERFP